jgi:CRISPR-associated protein Cas1
MARDYYIFSSGEIKRKENTVFIQNEKGEKKYIPIEDIESIHLFGEVSLNTKFLNFISQNKKLIHFYNYHGFYSGSFLPRDTNVSGELLIRQVEFFLAPEKRLELAKKFLEGAAFNIIKNLKNYSGTDEYIEKINEELRNLEKAKDISQAMGCEGRIRSTYYDAFNVILKEGFSMEKREKRPPTNPINALISFGNSLMYTQVLNEIYKTQLNPTISYLHEPSKKRYSLCLDIAEIFKPVAVDTVIFKLVNNKMITLDDFESDVGYCYLNEEGRKKFVKEFDTKLSTTIKHRKLKRNVSYKTLIRLECYKLIKHFVQDEVYKPFKVWW